MRNIFLAPFTSYLWAAIAIAFLALTTTMTALAFLLEKRAKIEQFDSAFIYDSCLVAIASLCQQGRSTWNSFAQKRFICWVSVLPGWSPPPVSSSLRSIFFTGCVTGSTNLFFLFSCYHSIVVSKTRSRQKHSRSAHLPVFILRPRTELHCAKVCSSTQTVKTLVFRFVLFVLFERLFEFFRQP